MSLEAVLKIGGSLSRGAALEALCREISRLGEHYPLLIVPGGGTFADLVRDVYRRYDLTETAAHSMALLAMDQYGYLLNRLIAGSLLTSELDVACSAADAGRTAVFLPSILVARANPLPHSWEVTSDSISAWIAHRAHSRRLVLLKDVDGLLKAGRSHDTSASLIEEMTVEHLNGHSGGVDEFLPQFLASIHLETWVISGLHPERLARLLETGHTTGTRIRRN
jgi:aspartokinase-like uncharacterized kinase